MVFTLRVDTTWFKPGDTLQSSTGFEDLLYVWAGYKNEYLIEFLPRNPIKRFFVELWWDLNRNLIQKGIWL